MSSRAARSYAGYACATGFYLSLATGAGSPLVCEGVLCEPQAWRSAILLVLLFLALAFARPTAPSPRTGVVFVGALCVLPIVHSAFSYSDNPAYVLNNTYELFFGSALAIVFLDRLFRDHSDKDALQFVVTVLAAVLIAAVLVKAVDGTLFNRNEGRYLINGPIVFGWLMGMGFVGSFGLWYASGKKEFVGLSILFYFAVFWTFSKGPILACTVVVLYLTLLSTKFSLKRFALFSISVLVLGSFLIFYFGDSAALSRLNLAEHAATAGSEGSIRIRSVALQAAMNLALDHPLVGIGAGNFSSFIRLSGLVYPHNVWLEVFLEYGLFAGVAVLLIVAYAFVRAEPLIRAFLLFFALCLSFSGNISYLRYLMPFLYIALVFRRSGQGLQAPRGQARRDGGRPRTRARPGRPPALPR